MTGGATVSSTLTQAQEYPVKYRAEFLLKVVAIVELEHVSEHVSCVEVVEPVSVELEEPTSASVEPPTLRSPRPPVTLRDLFGLRGDEKVVRHGR